MIRIKIWRDGQGQIQFFSVKGHAKLSESGTDIVCAGVSAVTQGTINAIEALLQVQMSVDVQSGDLEAALPEVPKEKRRDVQLLLEAMMVMLNSIQLSYERYITIEELKRR